MDNKELKALLYTAISYGLEWGDLSPEERKTLEEIVIEDTGEGYLEVWSVNK